mgnify:CR=1 FL=1
MTFEILHHIDKLNPDGGTNDPHGDHSFHCPVCDSPNFKVNVRTRKWGTYGCDCASTEDGKRKIRNALSPAKNPNGHSESLKPIRTQQVRHWDYFKEGTLLINGEAGVALTVHRTDNGNGKRKIWQESRIDGYEPAEVGEKVLPYGIYEARQALENGERWIFWVEGEPCVDALRTIGLTAITTLGGSENFRPDRDGGHIPADRICILPDQDDAGIKYAEKVAAAYPEASWCFPFPGSDQWNGKRPKSKGLDIADWIAKGAIAEHILNGIGGKDQEPVEPQAEPADLRDDFLRDAETLQSRLDRGLAQIDQLPDVATRSVALHTLRNHLNLSPTAFKTLVQALSEAKAPKVSESFDDLMAEDEDEVPALIEDFLAAGLVLIAAEGHAGKSSVAYQLAEAVTRGDKFAGQFQCQKAPVLIVQKDESKKDAKVKWRRMGLQPAQGSLTIKWNFSPMMFPELRRWITESGSKLVILDSLLTIAGGQISPKDAEFGLLIYRLNQLAGELGITIFCLHHVVKGGNEKKRVEITKDDIYGTAYVYNGAADAWGLWRSIEDGTGDTMFSLRCLKARSGLVDLGTTYEFIGNDEDRRMIFKGLGDRTITLDEIKNTRDKIRVYLERSNGAQFTPQQLTQALNLGSTKYAARLCSELFDRRSTTGVERDFMPSTGGRRGYVYFSARNSLSTGVEKSLLGEKSMEPSNFCTTFPPSRESSEREESEGVGEGFTPEKVLTREVDSSARDLPDWAEPPQDPQALPW